MKQGLYLISPDTFENAADLLNAVKNFAKDQTVDAFLYTFPDGADKNGHLNVLKKLIPELQAQNIAVLLKDDVDTAVKTGCDGVQVDYAPHLSELRKKIPDIALGVVCSSRHEAMTAGEAGADYIAFSGENILQNTLWWAELFNVPAVLVDTGTPCPNVDFIAKKISV